MPAIQTIRIFISSPGDVHEERDKARRVIDDLQKRYTGATLQPVLWEDLALPDCERRASWFERRNVEARETRAQRWARITPASA